MEIGILSKHRSQLLERLSELKTQITNIKAELAEASESQTNFLQDCLDHAKEQTDLNARFKVYQRYMSERLQIINALDRIKNGSFGACNQCGEMIPAQRLLVQPSAALCVECQCQKEVHTGLVMASVQNLKLSNLLPFFCYGAEVA